MRAAAPRGTTSRPASRDLYMRMASAYVRIVSDFRVSPCRERTREPRCRMYSTNSPMVLALYLSPPGAAGSTK
eukprot:5601113-Pleurochrysis_carterae.AAC.1